MIINLWIINGIMEEELSITIGIMQKNNLIKLDCFIRKVMLQYNKYIGNKFKLK